MKKANQPKKTVFSKLDVSKSHSDEAIGHLNPLSLYSKIIVCDSDKANLQPSLFCNMNFEVVNNTFSKKRGAEDSLFDDTFETPAKKPYSPSNVFPGLTSNSVDTPHDSLLDGLETSSSLNDFDSVDIEKSPIDLKCVEDSSLRGSDSHGNDKTVPNSVGSYSLSERVQLNSGLVFDFDVDNILCLSPINCYAVQHKGIKKRCMCPRNNWPLNSVEVKSPVPGQGMKQMARNGDLPGDVSEKQAGCEAANGVAYQGEAVKHESNQSKDESDVVQCTANVITRTKGEVLQDETQFTTEPGFTDQDVDTHLNGVPMCPVNNKAGSLAGDTEEVWSIGMPIFESTVCHSDTVRLSEGTEKVGQLVGSVLPSLQACQATVQGESTLDTSYETTLPIQVQVKSTVVVLPSVGTMSEEPPQPVHNLIKQNHPQNFGSKAHLTQSRPPRWHLQPDVCSSPTLEKTSIRRRPVIFDSEATWQTKKMEYVQSVKRHMVEGSRHAGEGPVTELHKLMSHVADGSQWQNPLDLTKRNYQRRFGNMKPSLSLTEWQTKNRSLKRFAAINTVFRTSNI